MTTASDDPERWTAAISVGRSEQVTIAVFGSKGGVGTTSITVNLAVAAASHGSRVVVVDLALPLGQVAMHLGVRSRLNVGQLVRSGSDGVARTYEPEEAQVGSVRLQFIAASALPDPTFTFQPDDIDRLVSLTGAIADVTVFDLGSALNSATTRLLAQAAVVVLVVSSDFGAIASARTLKEFIEDLRTGSSPVLVLNHLFPGDPIRAHDLQGLLGAIGDAEIRYDPALFDAVNTGSPVLARGEPTGASEDLLRVAATILENVGRISPEPHPEVEDTEVLSVDPDHSRFAGPDLQVDEASAVEPEPEPVPSDRSWMDQPAAAQEDTGPAEVAGALTENVFEPESNLWTVPGVLDAGHLVAQRDRTVQAEQQGILPIRTRTSASASSSATRKRRPRIAAAAIAISFAILGLVVLQPRPAGQISSPSPSPAAVASFNLASGTHPPSSFQPSASPRPSTPTRSPGTSPRQPSSSPVTTPTPTRPTPTVTVAPPASPKTPYRLPSSPQAASLAFDQGAGNCQDAPVAFQSTAELSMTKQGSISITSPQGSDIGVLAPSGSFDAAGINPQNHWHGQLVATGGTATFETVGADACVESYRVVITFE